MTTGDFQNLKYLFHDLCGNLSIEEIVSNKELMVLLSRFERLLNAAL